jgi:hypothetical protein
VTAWLWLGLALASEECLPADEVLAQAEQHLLLLEADLARAELATMADQLDCAWWSAEQLARHQLLTGAVAHLEGRQRRAAEAFRFAARAQPDVWIDNLGPELRQVYEQANQRDRELGTLDVQGLPRDGQVRVDGALVQLPVEVEEGEHLLQLGLADAETASQGRWMIVVPGQRSVLDVAPSDTTELQGGLHLHVGAGVALTMGESIDATLQGEAVSEPATKSGLPLELGVGWRTDRLWLRGQGHVAPLLGGGLLYLDGDGGVARARVAVGAAVAGGWSTGRFDLGLLGGVHVPSRGSIRAVLGVRPADDLVLELRVGADVHTVRGLEPGVGLHLAWQPALGG